MEVSAFYNLFSVGFSLLLKGIQELEASGLLLQVTLNLLSRNISAFYELVALPFWTPNHHFLPSYKRILNKIILFCLGTHVQNEYVNCILCLVNFLQTVDLINSIVFYCPYPL